MRGGDIHPFTAFCLGLGGGVAGLTLALKVLGVL